MCIKIIKIRLPCVNTDPQAPLDCRSTMSDESRWVLRVFRPTLNDPFYQPCQRALSHGIRILGGYLRAFHIEVSDPLDRSIYTTEPRFDLDACWRASNGVNLRQSVKILGVRRPNLTAMAEMGWATYARICGPCCDNLVRRLDLMEPGTDIPTPPALHSSASPSSASPSDGSPESSYSASGLAGDYTPGYSQAGGHPGDMSMLGAFPSEPPLYLERDPFESPDNEFALSAAESEDSNSPRLDDGDTNMAQNGTRNGTHRGPNLAHPQPSSSHMMNVFRPLVDGLTNEVDTPPPSLHYAHGNSGWPSRAAQAQTNGDINHNGTNGHTPGQRIPPWRLVNGNDHLNDEPPTTQPSFSYLRSEDRHRNAFATRQPFGPGESPSAAVANNVRGFAQNVPRPGIAVPDGRNGMVVLPWFNRVTPQNGSTALPRIESGMPQNGYINGESSVDGPSIQVPRARRGRGSRTTGARGPRASSTRGSRANGPRTSRANGARASRTNGARASRTNGVRRSTATGSARASTVNDVEGSMANGVEGSMANGVEGSMANGVEGSMANDAPGGRSTGTLSARGNRGRIPGLLVFPNDHPGLPFDQPDSPRSRMWWNSAHPRNDDLSGYTSSTPFNGSGPATSSDQEQSEPRTPSEPTGRRSSFLNVVLSNGHRHPSQSSGEGDEEEKID
jgi:hypothetical protein